MTVSGFEQQRVLRRVIKSTPTANQLTRVRAVRLASGGGEPGAVAQISSKEAASFGQRSSGINETAPVVVVSATKTKQFPATSTTTSTTTRPTTTTNQPIPTTTTTTSTTTTAATPVKSRPAASERQQVATEVELLSSAPSSWQTMTAVEAPAAALIAAGTRPATVSVVASDLSTASSEDNSHHSSEILRSSASSTKGSSYTQSTGETFSRLRQQNKQQQSFFYPQPAPQPIRASSKTSHQATKTHWYQPSTTQRPAPSIQEQQYEQQNEQYVEQQQQQVEYPSAPLGQAEPFAFDFKTQDNSGNGQYRKEESDKNGVVRGSYGYTDANGIYRHVEYVADQNGFRANIKSNEPGLIGETQPASIKLDGGSAPARISNQNNDNGDWTSNNNNNNDNINDGSSSADLAVAPPDFESSHRAERIRSPRHYRN